MRYGLCIKVEDPGTVHIAKRAGFDYVECNFTKLTRADGAQFDALAQALDDAGIVCETANCFLPADLPLFDGYDEKATREFLEAGFVRGARIGLHTVVFGAGSARKLPDGADVVDCINRFVAFTRDVASPIAAKYGVTVVIEPLSKSECNFINTLVEGAMMVAAVDRSNVKLLADNYHMESIGEGADDVRKMRGIIKHSHISYPKPAEGKKRVYPSKAREWDYASFVDAVRDSGCTTCSVEASAFDFEKESFDAAELLRTL